MPEQLHKIHDAIKRENPGWDDSHVWAVATNTYKQSSGKGKMDADDPEANEDSIVDDEDSIDIASIKSVLKKYGRSKTLSNKAKEIFDEIKADNPDIDDNAASKAAIHCEKCMSEAKSRPIDLSVYAEYQVFEKVSSDWRQYLPYWFAAVEAPGEINETLEPIHSYSFMDDIIRYFSQHPYPNDVQVHQWAGELGVTSAALEAGIYALLTDLLKKQGLA